MYSIAEDTWRLSSAGLTTPRSDNCAAAVDGLLYTAGEQMSRRCWGPSAMLWLLTTLLIEEVISCQTSLVSRALLCLASVSCSCLAHRSLRSACTLTFEFRHLRRAEKTSRQIICFMLNAIC